MKIAFGLDISGYSTGKSGLARAEWDGNTQIAVTVFRSHAFAEVADGKSFLSEVVKRETEWLAACLNVGPVFIDAPLDLQGLPAPKDITFIWELTKRPIDFAFEALPPLAHLIGSPVARALNLLSAVRRSIGEQLGIRIFETYPAASLQVLNLPHEGYKPESVHFKDGKWRGGLLAQMAQDLGFTADEGTSFTDDDFDAIICALTGVVDHEHQLKGDDLAHKVETLICRRLSGHTLGRSDLVPSGYVLLRGRPDVRINVIPKHISSPKDVRR